MLQIATSSSQGSDIMSDTNLMSQNVMSSWRGRRKLPLVFTEHGALMLASVLNSPTALQASIYVVRAFVKLTFEKLEEHSGQLVLVFQALRELVQ